MRRAFVRVLLSGSLVLCFGFGGTAFAQNSQPKMPDWREVGATGTCVDLRSIHDDTEHETLWLQRDCPSGHLAGNITHLRVDCWQGDRTNGWDVTLIFDSGGTFSGHWPKDSPIIAMVCKYDPEF
jgi:hypothetical protein